MSLGALWSASGYIGAFIRASNAIYEVEEGRKFYILRPLQILVTSSLVLLTVITLGPDAPAAAWRTRSATRSASATPR